MSQKLVDFLKTLAADPKKVKQVKEHFDRETKQAGLDKEEIRALRMGDVFLIMELVYQLPAPIAIDSLSQFCSWILSLATALLIWLSPSCL